MLQLSQLRVLFFTLFCTLLLVACSGAKEDEAVKSYLNAIASGNADKAVSMLYFAPEDTKNAAEKAAIEGKLKAMLIEMKEKQFDPRGGLKKIEINNKEFSDDKKKVTARYTMIFGDGTNEEGSLSLILVNNEWKIAVK